jgi:hypothetical protein
MRIAFFWVIMQQAVVNFCRRFGTTCLSHLHDQESKKLLKLEDEIYWLSRIVGKKSTLLAA